MGLSAVSSSDTPCRPMSATIYTAINGDLRASRKSFPQQINRRCHSGTKIKKEKPYYRLLFDGVPEGIRTPDLTLRRGALYPAELLRPMWNGISPMLTLWNLSVTVVVLSCTHHSIWNILIFQGFSPMSRRLGGGRSILLSYMGICTFS